MKIHRRNKDKSGNPLTDNMDLSQRYRKVEEIKLGLHLEENLKTLLQLSGNSIDVKFRRFSINKNIPGVLIYIDSMINNASVEEILRVLMIDTQKIERRDESHQLLRTAIKDLITVNNIEEVNDIYSLFAKIALGSTAVLIDGQSEALVCDTTGFKTRDITDPSAETTIQGPREGFVETLWVNTSLIRRQIRVPHLWIEGLEIGKLTKTMVAFAYIKGLADEKMLAELRSRLNRIDTDSILGSGYIKEFITDQPFSIFPLLLRTERPDIVCSAILEGKVGLFVSGSPHVLVLPAELPMFLQSPDDYYEDAIAGSFVRILRWAAVSISVLLPSFYVASVNFHQELLPTALLLRVTASREGVPFPVFTEILIMELLFEVLREAGIRLPAAIGPAISIVGALVLGEAAIRAGMVSPAVVIVVALTAIAGFTTPVYSMSIAFRLTRFAFTLLAAVLGLFGVQFGLLLLTTHLCSLRSFGMPYMMPVAPLIMRDMKDNIFRLWVWGRDTRPKLPGKREPYRQASGQKPGPVKGYNKKENKNGY